MGEWKAFGVEQLVWWCLVVHLLVSGSMATVGSINLQWWWQDRAERLLGSTGVLCWSVALVLLVGAIGLAYPYTGVWQVLLPTRAVLIGLICAVFVTTLSRMVRLPAVRPAVVTLVALPVVFVVLGQLSDLAYVFVPGSPWARFQPLGNLLVGGSLILLVGYASVASLTLSGLRRRQLAIAMVIAAGLVIVALVAGPGVLGEAMTTLWTVPIALLLAWWCSTRVLTLQGSLLSAVAGWQEAERQAQYQARHDQLTGLPNQAAAAETLDELLRNIQPDNCVVVSHVRVNRLEHIRASAGSQTADRIIRAVAEHLVSALPADAAVAKVGEVSFVVMTPRPRHQPVIHTEARVEEVVARLQAAVNLPTELTIVVGLVTSTTTSTATELLHQATIAVTAAEQAGRPVQIFTPELKDALTRRARTIRLLTAAVDRKEFELHYQPVVTTGSLERVGVEALVRWRHHGRLHAPAEWIPIAEQQGLMPSIGLEVLRLATRDHGVLGCPIAVNVSPHQLEDPGFADAVLDTLGDCPPAAVILEITENSIMSDLDQAHAALEKLRGHGLRIAVDDFGTQYSSLSRLATVPFDILKIDRSFVTKVLSGDGRAMVTAIHAMAAALGKITVAEGVETDEQLQVLTDIGCDRIQGYLTGRPAPLHELMATTAL